MFVSPNNLFHFDINFCSCTRSRVKMASKQRLSATRPSAKPAPSSNAPKTAIKKKSSQQPKPTPKSQSKASFKKLKSTADVEEARKLTAFIVQHYNGSHLYPLSAIATLARFPRTFDIAVDHIFKCLTLFCKSPKDRKPRDDWKTMLRSSGAGARGFKNYDEILAKLVCTEWVRLSEDGRETEMNAGALHDRIEAFWTNLMKYQSFQLSACRRVCRNLRPSGPKQLLKDWPGPSMILQTSLTLLKLMERRRIVVLKVNRVAGDHLPLELANIIKDHIRAGDELLEVAKTCSFAADDQQTPRAREICGFEACWEKVQEGELMAYNLDHSAIGTCTTKCGELGPYHKVTNLSVGSKHIIVWKRSDKDAFEKVTEL